MEKVNNSERTKDIIEAFKQLRGIEWIK